ncbi:hypothetical protein [uncultured Paraglaciecola sp.]|nr:hypothetical protein [uncultured Paraglaciecola sp.]
MSNNSNSTHTDNQRGTPSTEDRGLQPAKNPPPMPQVKPTKSEKTSKK